MDKLRNRKQLKQQHEAVRNTSNEKIVRIHVAYTCTDSEKIVRIHVGYMYMNGSIKNVSMY